MARKARLIVIWPSLPSFKTKWSPCLMSNWFILLKRPYIVLTIAPSGSKCENNILEVMAWESFPGLEFNHWTTASMGSAY